MSSLKYYYAPLFTQDKAGHLKFLAVPPKGRTLTKEEYEIWFALEKKHMWVGLDLPKRHQCDDIEILSLIFNDSDFEEGEEEDYE